MDAAAVCVLGPTASGKTALAVGLAQRYPFDIVSVDSVMIYRGMDIGSAKPDAATLAAAPHRLIDILDPAESYSAAQFRADALRHLHDIRSRGRIPLLVGGTMLYFRALQQGLNLLPPTDPELRRRLYRALTRFGHDALHRRLERLDAVTAARLHRHDTQRLLRALEVYLLSGRTLTELTAAAPPRSPIKFFNIRLLPNDRGGLHGRIEQRFAAMLARGLIDEVAALKRRPDLHPDRPALRAVGYRQVWDYLDGRYDRAEMTARALSATRQYAKRQLTWLRHQALAGDALDLPAEYRPEHLPAIITALSEKDFLP